jgi:hypothetical protein
MLAGVAVPIQLTNSGATADRHTERSRETLPPSGPKLGSAMKTL